MQKISTVALVLLVTLILSSITIGINSVGNNNFTIKASKVVTFAMYTGNMELNSSSFNVIEDVIKGKGYEFKTIDSISFETLENVDVLILPTTNDIDENTALIIQQYMILSGGNVFYILPQDPQESAKKFLEKFGIEILGSIEDNQSYFENKTSVILNGSWLNNFSLLRGVSKILYVNGTALNISEPIGFFESLNISSTSFNISENKSLSLYYKNVFLWGNNSTYVEYKKSEYINGTNVSLAVVFEFWWGSKLLVISSPYVFADRYLYVPDYDNLVLLRNIISLLAGELNRIDISLIDLKPNVTPIDLRYNREISCFYRIITYDVSKNGYYGQDPSEFLDIYVGIEFQGKLRTLQVPNVSATYNSTIDVIEANVTTRINVASIFNRSVVVYLRIVVINKYYGFFWGKAIRLELFYPKYVSKKWDPILVTFGLIVLINLIALVIVFPRAWKAKKSAKEIYESLLKEK